MRQKPGIVRQHGTILVLAVGLMVIAPVALSTYNVGLLAKYCCFAIAAVGISLAWGRGGMLVLGQGLFFGLGGYAMAMHLTLADAGPAGVPEFMVLYADSAVPPWWEPFRDPGFTLAVILLLPALVAIVIGVSVLKRRVRGAYFAILCQALAAAFALWLVSQIKSTGGANGLTNFRGFFGYALHDAANKMTLFYIVVATLIIVLVAVTYLNSTRYGEVLIACRDGEDRLRFFGYDPAMIKTGALATAALLAGIAGALFVPVAGIISPADVGVPASITLLAGAALGGRTSPVGAAVGAIVIGAAETALSGLWPGSWSYVQGALFIVIVLLVPGGIAALRLRELVAARPWARRRSEDH